MTIDALTKEITALKDQKSSMEKYISFLFWHRQIIELNSDNRNLTAKIISIKQEMVEKMNEASDIYQKGLEMLSKKSEPVKPMSFEPIPSSLAQYMIGSSMCATHASVKPIISFS